MDTLSPLTILLVKQGGGGDRILFRYPHTLTPKQSKRPEEQTNVRSNPYSLPVNEDPLMTQQTKFDANSLVSFSSKALSGLFSVHRKLCDQKFELKIDDVRFVGHPISLELKPGEEQFLARKPESPLTMFHIVFALRAVANYSVVQCYHELSLQLGVAIKYEERRCGYLTAEAKTMGNAQEEMGSMPEDAQTSPFDLVLQRSELAKDLRQVFDDCCQTGIIEAKINKWIDVSFCLPQKVHRRHNPNLMVEPEAVFQCLEALRPYHGLLLLYDEKQLIEELPIDGSPALKRLLKQSTPMKNFRALASDTDLSLKHVFELTGHLLYWGKATVVYPLCESNVYVISPGIPNLLSPVLVERFNERFPGESIVEVLAMFSYPSTLAQRSQPPFSLPGQTPLLAQLIVWCLQHHLLVQLHSYVTIAINDTLKTNLRDPLTQKFESCSKSPVPFDDIASLPDSDMASSFTSSIDEPVMPLSMSTSLSSGKLETVPEFSETTVVENQLPPATPVPEPKKSTIQESLLADFSEKERSAILEIPAANNLDDLKLFMKVAKYFNGRYHLEEIMYHENVRRSQLLQLMDKFRSILIRHEHEDPAVTMYFNSSMRGSNK